MAGKYNDMGLTQLEAGFGYEDNFYTMSVTGGIVAKASGTQATATPMTSMVNIVTTVATINDAVKLPPAKPTLLGVEIEVINDATNAMKVFAAGSDTVNGVAGATGVVQMGSSAVFYTLKNFNTATGVGQWIAAGIGSGYAGSLPTFSTQTNITASTTHTQGGGTPITASQAEITVCANPGDAVTLPAAIAGMEITIVNNGAQTAQVYGTGSDTLNGTAGATGIAQTTATPVLYFCFQNGKWVTK